MIKRDGRLFIDRGLTNRIAGADIDKATEIIIRDPKTGDIKTTIKPNPTEFGLDHDKYRGDNNRTVFYSKPRMKYGGTIDADGSLNWGTVTGEAGYGLRDYSGRIQFKDSGGSWSDIDGKAGDEASYILTEEDPDLANSRVLDDDTTYISLTDDGSKITVGWARGNDISQWSNDSDYVTPSSENIFTNKDGDISQWNNDVGFTDNIGTVTPSSTDTFTNKGGSNTQWTNDQGYGSGDGSVTSVAATGTGIATVTGSPITTTGTIDIDVEFDHAGTITDDGDIAYIPVVDTSTVSKKITLGNIGLEKFDNSTSGFTTNTGTVTSIGVTDGNLIDSSGGPITASGTITINVDLGELADGTDVIVGSADEMVYLDNGAQKRKQIDEIYLGQFNNDQGWTSNAGTVTNSNSVTLTNKTMSGGSNTLSNISNGSLTNDSLTVTAGTGLSGGGVVQLGGSITLNNTEVSSVIGGLSAWSSDFTGEVLRFTATSVVFDFDDNDMPNTDVVSSNSSGVYTVGAAGGYRVTTYITVAAVASARSGTGLVLKFTNSGDPADTTWQSTTRSCPTSGHTFAIEDAYFVFDDDAGTIEVLVISDDKTGLSGDYDLYGEGETSPMSNVFHQLEITRVS